MKILNFTKSELVKNSLIYGVTNALYTGLPLILMPFLVAIVQPQDYGIIELFRSFTLIFIPIIGLSTISCVDRFFFDYDEAKYKSLLGSLIILHFILGILSIVILSSISSFLPEKYGVVIFLAIIFCVFNQIQEIYLVSLRVKGRPVDYLKIRVGSVILDLSLLVLAYYLFNSFDWTFRVIPNVASTVFVGIIVIMIGAMKKEVDFHFSKPLIITAIAYSAPLILHMISGYVLNISNRFFVIHYQGEKELGNFSLAYQIGMAVSFFYTSFNMAWTPTFYSWIKNGEIKKISLVRKIVYFSLIILGVIIFIGWKIMSYYYLQDKQYVISDFTILILIVAFILLSLYKFEGNYFFYYKKTAKLSLFTLISCIVATLLNFLLIPKYGTLGAAYSTLLSYFVLFVLVLINNSNLKDVSTNLSS